VEKDKIETNFSLMITAEMYEHVREAAYYDRVSMSEWVRRAINNALQVKPEKQ
jgi:predicted HicB family RNase H-like nuclease